MIGPGFAAAVFARDLLLIAAVFAAIIIGLLLGWQVLAWFIP